MKLKFYIFSVVGFFPLLLYSTYSLAGITVSSPSATSSILACGNFTLYYTATSGFSTYVDVEVHQNDVSGAIVKTFSNVSSGYLAANYNNILSASGLAPGNYQIKMFDHYNTSFNGVSAIFTISALSPPASITIVSGQTTPTGFELAWSTASGASEYRVDISTTSDFLNIVPSYNDYHASASASGGFYVSGLASSQAYYIRIRAYTSCNTSGNSSTATVTTLSCPSPPVPTATAATNVKTAQFTANWGGVSGATSYDLIVTYGSTHHTYNTTGTSYTVLQAHPASGYSYTVKSRGCAASAESNSITLTTTALATPVIHSNQIGGEDDESRFVKWNPIDGADHYHVKLFKDEALTDLWDELNVTETICSYDQVPCTYKWIILQAVAFGGEVSPYSSKVDNDPCCDCRITSDGSKDNKPIIDQPIDWIKPFVFFPNPADNLLTVGLPPDFHFDNFNIKTLDATGREVVLPYQITQTKATFDLSGINSGLYIMTFTDGIVKHRSKFLRK